MVAMGVLLLCQGVGCQKDPPNPNAAVSCRDGTCCGPKGIHYLYAESYENVPATLTGPYGGWFLEFKKPLPTGTKDTWKTAAQVCDLTLDDVIKIKQVTPNDTLIRCRVWGRLYIGDEIPIYADFGSPRFFAIDRIEAVK